MKRVAGSIARDGRPVAGGAHRRVLAAEGFRVEPGTVRIEPATALGRVAAETVPFRMTGHAALQVLASGLTMVQEEFRLGVMVARATQAIRRAEAGTHVAIRAELRLVVTIGAGLIPRVRGGRMGRQKSGRMVSGTDIRRIGTVTIQALGAGVTGPAALRPG